MLKLRVVCFHYQKEPIARCERKIRSVKDRMIRLRRLVQNQHPQNSCERGAQHGAFKRNRNKCRPAVVRLTANVQRVVDHFHPILHEKTTQCAQYAPNKNDQRQTCMRKTNRFREFLDRIRRVAVDPSIASFIGASGSGYKIARVLKLGHDTVKRWRMTAVVRRVGERETGRRGHGILESLVIDVRFVSLVVSHRLFWDSSDSPFHPVSLFPISPFRVLIPQPQLPAESSAFQKLKSSAGSG